MGDPVGEAELRQRRGGVAPAHDRGGSRGGHGLRHLARAVGERLDLEPEKVADYIAEVGNTSAASIPLTLALLRDDGRLHAGQRVLVSAIGAGFTWGAGTIDWQIA